MLGVYDSGVGGLTVVKELRRKIPNAGLIYVGDTARAPYGGKDPETLFSHGCEIIRFLLKKGAVAIVVACGTSSSVSLDALREEFPGVPFVDTIRPGTQSVVACARQHILSKPDSAEKFSTVEACAQQHILSKPDSAGSIEEFRPVFIGTEGTVKSGLFAKLFAEALPDCELIVRACPLFAPIVEAGISGNHPLANFAADHYLADLKGRVNALVLGCTHYPLLTDAIRRTLGDITFINPAEATALAAKAVWDTLPATTKPPKTRYYATGDPKNFAKLAKHILGEKLTARQAKFTANA